MVHTIEITFVSLQSTGSIKRGWPPKMLQNLPYS